MVEGTDESIWVAATAINVDGEEFKNIHLLKLSADLDSMEMDEELDLMGPEEHLYGISLVNGQLIMAVSTLVINESTGFLERDFSLLGLTLQIYL